MSTAPVPALRLPDESMDPEAAYRFIHDELMLDGSSRLNLATFVTTWMDPEAEKLMAETFDKNMIDKDEYPATAAIEQRCVCMVADLFHAEDLRDDDPSSAIGVSTIGSSEAVMLAGLAMKWRWREKVGKGLEGPHPEPGDGLQRPGGVGEVLPLLRRRAALPADGGGSLRHHPRAGPRTPSTRTPSAWWRSWAPPTPVSSNPIAEICAALDKLAAGGGVDVPVHVDAASGGFVVPFLHPELKWDFRLPRVVSINVSGHKYGLTYPGIGFVVWRSAGVPARGSGVPGQLSRRRHADLHAELLPRRQPGGRASTTTSCGWAARATPRSCSRLSQTARWLGEQLRVGEHFDVISDGSAIPVVTFQLARDRGYTEFDVSHELRALRLAGARLHDARQRRRTSPCCASWSARASPPTWPGRCTTTPAPR